MQNRSLEEYNYKQEKKENWSESLIFILLNAILIVLIISFSILFIEDLKLMFTGNSVKIDCKKDTTLSGNYLGKPVEIEYLNNNGKVKINYKSSSGASISEQEIIIGCAFKDNDNNVYIVDLSRTLFSTKIDKKITVYYYDNHPEKARTLTSIWFWIFSFGLLFTLLFIFIKSIYNIFHKSKHYIA